MKKSPPNAISAFAPGKIILSGEHAVVYGCPALAIPTEAGIECELKSMDADSITIHFPEHAALTRSLEDISNYDPASNHLEIVFFLLDQLKTNYQIHLEHGLEFNYQVTIPVGCGMGASAAFIIATLRALLFYFDLELEQNTFYQLAKQAEDIFHGNSSGLDVMVSLQDAPIYFQQGEFTLRPEPKIEFEIINSGKAQSSTAECVQHARQALADNPELQQQFTDVTNTIDQALSENNRAELIDAIKRNHHLLCQIGVVPESIQQQITELEQQGYAAKICGAGSIAGDNAGIILKVAVNE